MSLVQGGNHTVFATAASCDTQVIRTAGVPPLAFSSPPPSAISAAPRCFYGIVADAFRVGNQGAVGWRTTGLGPDSMN
jgi:hypothetical protein